MGQVTIFEKKNCTYCEKTFAVLKRLTEEVYADIGRNNPGLKPELTIKRVDCGLDGAYAALCIRLTGTFTVPHVFFNEEYVGDATQFCCLDSNCKDGCNILYSKLKALALKKSPESFPPAPDAAMIKVTETLAFSSQPTKAQLKALKSFGFESVMNVLRGDSGAFQKDEEEILASNGLLYLYKPLLVVTLDSLLDSIESLKKLPTPILVHCDSGQRSGMIVLLKAAQELTSSSKVTEETFFKWAKDLGLDLLAFSKPIGEVLHVLQERQRLKPL